MEFQHSTLPNQYKEVKPQRLFTGPWLLSQPSHISLLRSCTFVHTAICPSTQRNQSQQVSVAASGRGGLDGDMLESPVWQRLNKYSAIVLKGQCQMFGLQVFGTKPQLIARLVELQKSTAIRYPYKRPKSETLSGKVEEIAQEFVNIPPILVVDKGILCDYQQLMSKFSQMSGGGLYLWLVKPPRGRKWIAVYLGKGQKLGKRLQVYVHRSGVWGPSGEAEKQARMYDLQRRGFSVQLMIMFTEDLLGCDKDEWLCNRRDRDKETEIQSRVDFPLNYHNGSTTGYRNLELPRNKILEVDYPILF